MRERKVIDYHVVGREDIIDEKGNQVIQLRNIYYKNNEDNVKLDIRKWAVGEDGKEIMGKGLSFLTEEGPNTLAEVLLDRGYGNTQKVLTAIKDREDFKPALNTILGKSDDLYDSTVMKDEETTFYDPKQCSLF